MSLSNKNILLGVTGGIAAYKSAEIVRGLVKKGAGVRVVMTESAMRFITPLTLAVLSKNQVNTGLWEGDQERIDHVSISSGSDLFLIAPATANTLGKIAHGLADNLLTNLFLTFKGPVVVCPSMNSNMYLHPAVQANLEILRQRGVHIIAPAVGELACGVEGVGRMPAPEAIVMEVETLLMKRAKLSGKKILITAGPTREFFDAVRFISNPSSGKMGYAIAEAAARRGADVVLVSGPSLLPKPAGVRLVNVVTAEEMNEAVMSNLKDVDAAIMAAAVSDYRPVGRYPEKLKKGEEKISNDLERTPDILENAGKRKNGFLLVGFAAETEGLLENAREKMLRKNCDMMVGNLVNSSRSGFESDENEVMVISKKKDTVDKLPLMSKRQAAERIMDKIIEEMGLD
ncbi:MAG: bifunctional phosphopantothenoylcysteine decarboxylase/phosphopantothenate--cysteine ligase CoaBC [Nitrospinae bacterium]|nr:bifunctional phosphopantothenoylcysteine decarboxylase/phosphopantothenate--cysteine ligase CoaBC [Nitrospinota bacterium]